MAVRPPAGNHRDSSIGRNLKPGAEAGFREPPGAPDARAPEAVVGRKIAI